MSLILGIVFLRAYMAPKTGIISGEVCYPSEYYPAMTIYLRNTESQKIRKTETKEGEKDFIFENIGKGEYVVYAYTNEQLVGNEGDPFKEKAHGGYTFAVICGLSVECENHNLVPVDVNPGDELTDIKICDWYGAVVPPE